MTITYTLVRTALVFAVRRMSALGAQLLSKLRALGERAVGVAVGVVVGGGGG